MSTWANITDADQPLQALRTMLIAELGMTAQDQCYFWNQKINIPPDDRLYLAISVVDDKVFGNVNSKDGSGAGLNEKQSVYIRSHISLDLISRTIEARTRRWELIAALKSTRARQMQENYACQLASIPTNIVNLSEVDGAAIPYRFNATVALLYKVTKTQAVDYFDTFQTPQITVEP